MSQRKTYSVAEDSGSSTSVYSPSSISVLQPPSVPPTTDISTNLGVSGELTTSLVDKESYYSKSPCPSFLISDVVPSTPVTTSFTASIESVVTASPPVLATPGIHVHALPVMSAATHPPPPPVNSASPAVPVSPIIWVSNPVPASKYPQPSYRASKAWKYYDVPENTTRMSSTQVRCRLCHKIIPRGPGAGTTTMYRHLFRHHWHGSPSVSSEFRKQHSSMRQREYPNLQDIDDDEVSTSRLTLVSKPVHATRKRRRSHRTSDAWQYYNMAESTSQMPSTQVSCRLCHKIVLRGPGGCTSSMYSHLFRHHWHGSRSVSSDFRRKHSAMRQRVCPNLRDVGDEEISDFMLPLESRAVPAPRKRRRSHRTSEAWKYYDVAENTDQKPSNQVRCRLCRKIVLRGPNRGCTSSMYSHLFRHHWHGSPSVSSDFRRQHSAMRQRVCPNLQGTGDEEISNSMLPLESKPVPAPKKRRQSHRTSEAWKYYDMAENTDQMPSTQVSCRLCHKIVLRGPNGGCTSSMYSHLFRHHWHGSPSVSSDFRRKHSAMRQRVCPNVRETGDELISSSNIALVSASSGEAELAGEYDYDRDAAHVHLA